MKISILTLFPEMFAGPFDHSIVKRAQEKGFAEINFVNIRDFGIGKHRLVDDTVYGGGIGMVMRVDVLHKAIETTRDPSLSKNEERVVLLGAHGTTFNQRKAKQLSDLKHLILICGHYEGVDERIKAYIDEEVSIGDFVVTGGELPAMLITDAVVRLQKGFLKDGATDLESFSYIDTGEGQTLLEYPHYTKPAVYENRSVPEILLSGNHAKIKVWREEQAREQTKQRRPDLLKAAKETQ